MKNTNLKCASFFAGVGGIDLGFERAGFEIIYANEIDTYAIKTYEQNFNITVDQRDIRDVDVNKIPNFDILLAGFPCQSFSVAGYGKGFDDEKNGTLFFELERIIKVKKPKIIFLENVKNLVSHNNGKSFGEIRSRLEGAGYYVSYQVLNSLEYGNVPQNRERVYIVAFQNKNQFSNFSFPVKIPLETSIKELIMFDIKFEERFYYLKHKCKFYDNLERDITDKNCIYQWRRSYVRKNNHHVCPTLTANMGTGGNNVPIILSKYGIRKLTPRECFNLQGFPKMFILPNLSISRLYKQAGNTVVVPVIERIARVIRLVIEGDKKL